MSTTACFGDIEIRDFAISSTGGPAEQIFFYPMASVRLELSANLKPTYLHLDQLGSVRGVSDETGLVAHGSVFKPHGEEATYNRAAPPRLRRMATLANATTPTPACNTSTPAITTQGWGCSSSPTGGR